MSHIGNIIEKFKGDGLSEDQVIAAIVSQAKYATEDRDHEEIVKAWRLLAGTGKLSADKAYDVGCIAADSEVWTTFFKSAVFQSDKLFDYAMLATQKEGHVDMWRAVAASVDSKLLSVDQMFYVAERARSEKFSTAVLTSGRLSVMDVLTRGMEIFFHISSYVQDFREFLNEHFDADFWDKEECLAALKESKRIAPFAWVAKHVALSKEDMDQVIMLARIILNDHERRLVDECVASPIVMKNQHSVEEVFAIIDSLDGAHHSRFALLSSKKEELSHEQILDVVLREPVTKEILQKARAILANKKSV